MLPEDVETIPTSGSIPSGPTKTNCTDHRAYWEDFYHSRTSVEVPSTPSPFARWVAGRELPNTSLVDVGSGTGRDTLWFSRRGFSCVGLDYASAAVETGLRAARDAGLPADFKQANLYDDVAIARLADLIRRDHSPEVVYGRFLLHAIGDDARQNLWGFAKAVLPTGGRVYTEFRTQPTRHEFGEHFRHFVDPKVVVSEVEAMGGRVIHLVQGRGLAVYKAEDPEVCRLVFEV